MRSARAMNGAEGASDHAFVWAASAPFQPWALLAGERFEFAPTSSVRAIQPRAPARTGGHQDRPRRTALLRSIAAALFIDRQRIGRASRGGRRGVADLHSGGRRVDALRSRLERGAAFVR